MGTWTRVVRATLAAHSGESAAAAAMRVLTRCMSMATIWAVMLTKRIWARKNLKN